VGGYIIGCVLLVPVLKFEEPVVRKYSQLGFGIQLMLSIACPLLLLAVFPETASNQIVICATLMGGGLGLVLNRRYIRFDIAADLFKRVIAYLLGMVILFVIYLGLKFLFSELEPILLFRFIRYTLIGFYIVFVAPWLFVKFGLASSLKEK
jgi:positive regulator of sigma E activity